MLHLPLSEHKEGTMRVDLHSRGAPSRGGKPIWASRQNGYDAIFVLSLVLVGGLSVFIGIAAPLGSFAHDTFFLLGNAYRVTQGQVPSRDFSSAWGPVMFLIEAAGLALAGMRPAGIGYANAVFGCLIAVWAFLMVRPRWSSASACAAGVFTLCLIAAPFPLGYHPFDFGYSMIYNRYGYAIFGIIVIECSPVPPAGSAWSTGGVSGAVSTGVALGLLAFLKVSYAIVALPFIAFSMIGTGTGTTRRLMALCTGFAALAFLALLYVRFDITGVLRDLQMAATSRRLSLRIMHPIGLADTLEGVALVAVSLLLCRTERGGAGYALARFRWVLFALLTLAAGYLLLISNQQTGSFPLNGYAAVTMAAAYPRQTNARSQNPMFSRRLPQALLLAFCLLPLCLASGASMAGAAAIRQWPQLAPGVALTARERGATFVFRRANGPVKTEVTGAEYVEAIDDGLGLLRRHVKDDVGVLAFDEFNPFNYLLDRPSPRGGMAAAAYDYVFCDAVHPTPERFFGTARYVIVRKYLNPLNVGERDDVAALMRIYGPALRKDFTWVAETKHWVLWRRMRHSGEPPPG